MESSFVWGQIAIVMITAIVCLLIHKSLKRVLLPDQRDYVRDLTLTGSIALLAIAIGSRSAQVVVAFAILALVVGIARRYYPHRFWPLAYILIGLFFSAFGPRISFMSLPRGEYYYFSPWASIMVTTIWMALFPLLLQELDQTPGLMGHLLAVVWLLMSIVTFVLPQHTPDAVWLSAAGLAFTAVFWSRHGHPFRRLGEPLAGMWGVLIAGTSILGVSKGVTFTVLLFLPLGLFALPILETSLYVASRAFAVDLTRFPSLYRRFISMGIDHPKAIRLVALVCMCLGGAVASSELPLGWASRPLTVAFLSAGVAVVLGSTRKLLPKSDMRWPVLWGIRVDNVSLAYVLSKVCGWIESGGFACYVVTPDALAAYRSRTDANYRRIVRAADMVLPDGVGLIWGLRCLGYKVQERIAGVEFMDQLCRVAAAQGWPVYLLGGKPGVAEEAACRLSARYPGLVVAGVHDGYFDETQDASICEEIRNSGARLLFVGMGSPKQEIWIDQNLKGLNGIVSVGVGGSFDVLSGRLKRAPVFWQRMGLEWLYRTVQEPWRIKRVSRLPIFAILVIMTRLGIDRWREEP